jgi:hypothetical protein
MRDCVMAGTRFFGLSWIEVARRSARRYPIFAAVLGLVALLAAVQFSSHIRVNGAPSAKSIDFSSLGIVVPVEEYSDPDWFEPRTGKHDKLQRDLPELTLATTGGAKADFTHPKFQPSVSAVASQYADKLRQHLEEGLLPHAASAANAETVRPTPRTGLAVGQGTDVVRASLRSAGSATSGAAGSGTSALSGDRTGGRRGALSGLLR